MTGTEATILQAISSVGFPIVACAAMFWKMNDQDVKHKAELEQLTKAIENNTHALNALANSVSK